VLRRLIPGVGASDARRVVLEVGAGQAADVGRMLRAVGFPDVSTIADLAGIERVVVGRR
jgi:methylase of polypeptide subunit release factors